MAPSATETITVPVAAPTATLKLYPDGSGDYKEPGASSSYKKQVEEEGEGKFKPATASSALCSSSHWQD